MSAGPNPVKPPPKFPIHVQDSTLQVVEGGDPSDAGNMASLAAMLFPPAGKGSDGPVRERKKLPKVVFIVSGAAMAMTIGLTAMMVPYLRQALRRSSVVVPDALSNPHLELRSARLEAFKQLKERQQLESSGSPESASASASISALDASTSASAGDSPRLAEASSPDAILSTMQSSSPQLPSSPSLPSHPASSSTSTPSPSSSSSSSTPSPSSSSSMSTAESSPSLSSLSPSSLSLSSSTYPSPPASTPPPPSSPPSSTPDLADLADLAAARTFNNHEERHLFGSITSSLDPQSLSDSTSPTSSSASASDKEDDSGMGVLMGAQALGIATALVFGSAGLGVFVVARLMGVSDMSEFRSRMRDTLQTSMPGLVSSIHKPLPVDHEPRTAEDRAAMDELDEWFRSLEEPASETETSPS